MMGALAGLLIGFVFTNTINRRDHDEMRAELERLRAATSTRAGEENVGGNSGDDPAVPRVSDEQLRGAIARADSTPNDLDIQRNLGRNLYFYASYTNDADIFPEAVRLLQRAHEGDPKNYEATLYLAHALLAMARTTDPNRFEDARLVYQQALRMKPDDPNVHTGLGMTHFFDKPSDPQRAIDEYRQALALDARHEQTLQNLASALIAVGDTTEAQKTIEELKSVNDQNPALPDIEAQLIQSRNTARERN